MRLTNFDAEAFLRDYWQKQPLLIRNPWEAWRNPLAPDELAGLSCEAEVESRLITRTPKTWKVEHGPFDEARFARLGKRPWTQLVQAVDHYVPEVAALVEPFRFVPNWRIDDVMVSLAGDGGGVGPHFDQYDVFLIQGLGKRRWRVGARCDQGTALLPHDDLRLLADFVATDEWVLEAGDILYVPPGFSHDGVAVGDDCMTYSIGFRAPSRGELIAHWCDSLLDELHDDDRYADPGLPPQPNPGEISADAIARLHAMATGKLLDRDAFARWFGQYNSTPKYPDIDWRPDAPITVERLRERLSGGAPLCRNAASRFSFVRQHAGLLLLFVDGECFECSGEAVAAAEQLCVPGRDVTLSGDTPAVLALIAALYNQGSLTLEPA